MKEISSPTTFGMYDITKKTKIQTDGSLLKGTSAVIYQQEEDEWKPADCASGFLTEPKKIIYPLNLRCWQEHGV